ncbi:hypothetical protein C0993_005595, partial [Termitomyces sp. T159_Od127]
IDKLHESGNESDQDWDPLLELDSLKPCWEKEDQESEDENTDDENMEILMEGWDDGIDDDEAAELWHVRLVKLAIENEDDPRDEEWVPAELRKKYLRKIKDHRGMMSVLRRTYLTYIKC